MIIFSPIADVTSTSSTPHPALPLYPGESRGARYWGPSSGLYLLRRSPVGTRRGPRTIRPNLCGREHHLARESHSLTPPPHVATRSGHYLVVERLPSHDCVNKNRRGLLLRGPTRPEMLLTTLTCYVGSAAVPWSPPLNKPSIKLLGSPWTDT